MSGTVIVKGPKGGHLFSLHFSIPNLMSLACTTIANKTRYGIKDWAIQIL